MSNKLIKKNYIEMDSNEEMEDVTIEEVSEEETDDMEKKGFLTTVKGGLTKAKNSKIVKGLAIAGAVAGGIGAGLLIGSRRAGSDGRYDFDGDLHLQDSEDVTITDF